MCFKFEHEIYGAEWKLTSFVVTGCSNKNNKSHTGTTWSLETDTGVAFCCSVCTGILFCHADCQCCTGKMFLPGIISATDGMCFCYTGAPSAAQALYFRRAGA